MIFKGNVLAVVGAQYGSEGKGNIVGHLADRFNVHVRTGGPNAGHTFYVHGSKYTQQCLPCGWANPEAQLLIGPGALIDPKQLNAEIKAAERMMGFGKVRERVMVDPNAGIVDKHHRIEEGGTKGELHERIGSTGEGVGAARAERMGRDSSFLRARGVASLQDVLGYVPEALHDHYENGRMILLEGTQGLGLSLIHGDYPYVTSHDTTPAQLAADAGIPAQRLTDVMLVARTYPIRVAGASGPLLEEIDFDVISERMGRKIVEKTTVTKKVRRIGLWDDALFIRSCVRTAPTSIALNFMDYVSPEDEGETAFDSLSETAQKFISMVEMEAGCPVSLIGTGGEPPAVIER